MIDGIHPRISQARNQRPVEVAIEEIFHIGSQDETGAPNPRIHERLLQIPAKAARLSGTSLSLSRLLVQGRDAVLNVGQPVVQLMGQGGNNLVLMVDCSP